VREPPRIASPWPRCKTGQVGTKGLPRRVPERIALQHLIHHFLAVLPDAPQNGALAGLLSWLEAVRAEPLPGGLLVEPPLDHLLPRLCARAHRSGSNSRRGRHVDVMYRSPTWIEEELARVLFRHAASVSYSTCLWHNVLSSHPLFDPDRWYGRLQDQACRSYSAPLRRAMTTENHAMFRGTLL